MPESPSPLRIHPMQAHEFAQVAALLDGNAYGKGVEGTVLARLRQLYGPLQRLSQCLPAAWQPLPAIYVACTGKQVAGLIWLQRETGQRWRIEQLLLHPEHGSLDVGERLLEFVIHRFGAAGVQQFLARVAVDNESALSLLKHSNFRQVDRRFDFHWEPIAGAPVSTSPAIVGLRDAHPCDAPALKSLYEETLSPTTRPYLDRPVQAFGSSLLYGMWSRAVHGRFRKRWLVETTHGVLGMVNIITDDHQQFHVEVVVSPGWQDGYSPLVQFALVHCHQHTSQPQVFIHHYGRCEDKHTQLADLGFACWRELLLLIKDYWKPAQTPTPLAASSPLLLVGGGEPSVI